jgi:hypothetical protein
MAYLYAISLLTLIILGLLQINIFLGMKIRALSRDRKMAKAMQSQSNEQNSKPEIITQKELKERVVSRKKDRSNGS